MLDRIFPALALLALCLSAPATLTGCVAEVGDAADAEAPAPKPQLTSRQSQSWNGRYYVCGNSTYYCRHPQSSCYFNGSQYRCTMDGLLNGSNGYYGNTGNGYDNGIYNNNGYNNGYNNNNNGYYPPNNNNGYYPPNNGYYPPNNNGYGNSCTPNYGNSYGNTCSPNNGYGNSCSPNYGNSYGNSCSPSYGNTCSPNYGNNNSYGNTCSPNYGNGNGLYYGNNQTGRYYVCGSATYYCRNPQSRCYYDGSRYMCSHDGSYGGYNYYNTNGNRWSYSNGQKPPTQIAKPDALGRLSFPQCEGDFDCDGVPDGTDKCSATLPRSTLAAANLVHVHTEGKWAGCAEGQIRDIGDHDRDGIPNSRDLCGQTTLYTLVSASAKLAGCSVAQNANVKIELDSSKLSPSAQEGDGTTDAKSSDPVSSL